MLSCQLAVATLHPHTKKIIMSDNESPAGSPVREEPAHNDVSDNEPQDAAPDASEKANDIADDESQLSEIDEDLAEIDENLIEDYDPETAKIEDRPVDIDEDVARTLKVSRRKRAGDQPKKPKEGRREKKKRDREGSVEEAEGEARPRKSRRNEGVSRAEPRRRASPEPDEDEGLTPEERRRRALDRALDAAVKGPTRRRKKRGDEVRSLTHASR